MVIQENYCNKQANYSRRANATRNFKSIFTYL